MLLSGFNVTTPRLNIRPYGESDFYALRTKIADRALPNWKQSYLNEQTDKCLKRILAYAADGTSFTFAAFHKDQPENLALDINFLPDAHKEKVWHVAYYTMQSSRGQSLMSEALPPVMNEFARAIDAVAFKAEIKQSNEASMRIVRKNGFYGLGSEDGWQTFFKDLRPKAFGG